MMTFDQAGDAAATAMTMSFPIAGEDYARIGELAKTYGVTLRTLRFYEDKGLLSPSATARPGSTPAATGHGSS